MGIVLPMKKPKQKLNVQKRRSPIIEKVAEENKVSYEEVYKDIENLIELTMERADLAQIKKLRKIASNGSIPTPEDIINYSGAMAILKSQLS